MHEHREWVDRLASNPAKGFSDWDPFCQDVTSGVFVKIQYVNEFPELPSKLRAARDRLRNHVMDESSEEHPDKPFNGTRYCLRKIVREVRRFGEKSGCVLEFGPSDYRTFLVTNGIDSRWAGRAGIKQFESSRKWGDKWGAQSDTCSFFRNSFGINALVSAVEEDGQRYVLFNERSERTAIRSGSTGGSVDEGLRRSYGTNLFDQHSLSDPTPDLENAAFRAVSVSEELGLTRDQLRGTCPILLSVGQVRSLFQPAALYYWPLQITVKELKFAIAKARDRHLEFSGSHFVPFTRESILDFVRKQEDSAPVESWVVAMALYALETQPQRRVFISHSRADRRFVISLAKRFKAHGMFVWVDEAELGIGDKLHRRLAEAVKGVDFVVAVVSKASVNSYWVQFELDKAMSDEIKGGKVKVLPLVKDDCKIPEFLTPKLFADCRTGPQRERSIRQLIRTIVS